MQLQPLLQLGEPRSCAMVLWSKLAAYRVHQLHLRGTREVLGRP